MALVIAVWIIGGVFAYLIIAYLTSLLSSYRVGKHYAHQKKMDSADMEAVVLSSLLWPGYLPAVAVYLLYLKVCKSMAGRKFNPWHTFFKMGTGRGSE